MKENTSTKNLTSLSQEEINELVSKMSIEEVSDLIDKMNEVTDNGND